MGPAFQPVFLLPTRVIGWLESLSHTLFQRAAKEAPRTTDRLSASSSSDVFAALHSPGPASSADKARVCCACPCHPSYPGHPPEAELTGPFSYRTVPFMPFNSDEHARLFIGELVHAFSTSIRALRDPQTLEAVVRQEYIDPFWKALGWDVANTAHRSAAEKDVVIEASVGTIEAQRLRSRRPDYLFRIDGFPRFIVEAKKPAVDLATDRDAIFQGKTYAWSAQIPFAILTDFEEFRLFDATLKPNHNEPERGLIQDFDLRYEDYPTQWEVLWATFGREAVAAGSLEQLLARIKRVRKGRRIRGIDRMLIDLRGSEPVDRAFLAHLEDYRERFARELYRENAGTFPQANTRHGAAKLTEAAQRLIDRLVFIRVCEDRDIAHWGGLRSDVDQAVDERAELYPILVRRFRQLDREYNGYLFKPHFSEELNVSGQLLADFIRSLYPPDGPYRFDAIGDDLLGIIYERFLGSIITVRRRRVEVEEKPEVRHAKGVYYTPRFVVDTIIRRVVGPQLENRAPLDVLNLKILDPACGSGSFLIAAFQYLMDHCLRHFAAHPDAAEVPATPRARKRKRKLAFQDADGQWNLAPDFKAAILTSCLYGVDIDAQAVEVTIMSLYLKMLEGKHPLHWQRYLLENQLLPPLDNNIRCGNSLLSQTDFDRWWEDKYGGLFAGDEDTRFRMNPFDWTSHTRGFGRILAPSEPRAPATGSTDPNRDRERAVLRGFDAIIGNPPYIRVQELNKWAPDECEFYKWRYRSAARGNYDIYVVFIERGLELLAPTGLLGFICPHKFLTKTYAQPLRRLLVHGRQVAEIIHFGASQVFKSGSTYTCILFLQNTANTEGVRVAKITRLDDGAKICEAIARATHSEPDVFELTRHPHPSSEDPWVFSASPLVNALGDFPILQDVASVFVGVQTDADDVYYVTPKSVNENRDTVKVLCACDHHEWILERDILLNLVTGTNIGRYLPSGEIKMVVFPFRPDSRGRHVVMLEKELHEQYPLAYKFFHSKAIRTRLEKRANSRLRGAPEFYDFIYRKNLAKQHLAKLCVPRLAESVRAAIDEEGTLCLDNVDVCGIIPSDSSLDMQLLLAYLNSALLDRYMKETLRDTFRGGYLSLNKQYLGRLPIKLPETAAERRDAERISERVRQIIDAKKRLQASALGHNERERLERQVEAHEAAIDELVYKLYGLSDEDTPVIEEGTVR